MPLSPLSKPPRLAVSRHLPHVRLKLPTGAATLPVPTDLLQQLRDAHPALALLSDRELWLPAPCRAEGLTTRFVVVTRRRDAAILREVSEAGVHGLLAHDVDADELQVGLGAIAEGRSFVSLPLDCDAMQALAREAARPRARSHGVA